MRGFFGKAITGIAAALAMTAAFGTAAERTPPEYQTSVQPAKQRVIPEGYYPATRVVMPEKKVRGDDAIVAAPWFHNFADGGNDIFAPAIVFEEETVIDGWWDHFATGGNAIFGEAEEEKRVEREAKTDDEGYLLFGAAVLSHNAYASMPLPDVYYDDAAPSEGGEEVRLPKPFSFESDDSPVILAGVTSPGSDGGMFADGRQNNRFRLFSGRRPAEIIERAPYNYVPDRGQPQEDTPAMAPASGGKVRRAEVKLPTSSQGLGMASGYFPGR